MKKVPCHYCGIDILEDTARRNKGYCMQHTTLSFKENIGGKFEIVSYLTQEQLEKKLPKKFQLAFDILQSLMLAGDKLVEFKTTPFNEQKEYAKSGYAIYRNDDYLTGFATRMAKNAAYYIDVETEVSKELVAGAFGKHWAEISEKLQETDKFIHFISSPLTWDCLGGREFYAVKRGEKYLYSKLVRMN